MKTTSVFEEEKVGMKILYSSYIYNKGHFTSLVRTKIKNLDPLIMCSQKELNKALRKWMNWIS